MVGATVSRMKLRLVPALALPAASVALMVMVWSPSTVPSVARAVVMLKLPLASRLSVWANPPSSAQVALATPDRLSNTWPVKVMLVLLAAGLVWITTVGACASCTSAKRCSTAVATCAPRALPASLE